MKKGWFASSALRFAADSRQRRSPYCPGRAQFSGCLPYRLPNMTGEWLGGRAAGSGTFGSADAGAERVVKPMRLAVGEQGQAGPQFAAAGFFGDTRFLLAGTLYPVAPTFCAAPEFHGAIVRSCLARRVREWQRRELARRSPAGAGT